jgi:hypothetical protein
MERWCGEGKTPAKEGANGAHRGSWSPARQFWWQRSDGVPTMAVAPGIGGGRLGLHQHSGRKVMVRNMEIEARVARNPVEAARVTGELRGRKESEGWHWWPF